MDNPPKLTLLFFYGKGSAGKDTEAIALVKENPDWAIISTGDRIKQAQNPTDKFYEIVAPHAYLIPQGRNLPDEVVFNPENPSRSIIPDFIETEIAKGIRTILSTGFPRTRTQLHALDQYLEGLRQNFDVDDRHFYFDVSDETSIRRTLGRAEEYRALGKTVRDDDTEIGARGKLATFASEIIPLIDELRNRGVLIEIDSEGTKDQTHASVEGVLFPRTEIEGEPQISIRLPGERK